MRSYPRNSPEAAALVVALTLISDGHVSRSEVETLQRLGVEPELALAPGAFAQVVHTLCEDLLMGAHGGRSMIGSVDASTLASWLAAVDDPGLQAKVLRFASAVADADTHMADAEALVISAAHQRWFGAASASLAAARGQVPLPA